MTMLEIALGLLERGFHIFPCRPRSKKPAIVGGKNWEAATNDVKLVNTWWAQMPDANIAIGGNNSDIAVLDIDYGLADGHDFCEWLDRNGLPCTYAVRTGRRPGFGVQMYFRGRMNDVAKFELDGCTGQIKSIGGYVMSAGSIHPDSGERYSVIHDWPIVMLPDFIRALKTAPLATGKDGGKITENRNNTLYSLLCKWRRDGMTEDTLTVAALQHNADNVVPPMDEEEVRQLARNAAKRDVPEPAPIPVFETEANEPKEPVDWRTRYVTLERITNAKPVNFLIEGFLALDSITCLAAPVGQRKSLIAMNVAHALLTGEPLFNYFKVTHKPERVVYLCPEMGLSSFSDRLKKLGLLKYVGTSLFCQTMDEECLKLSELNDELPGSVVVLDTLTRFVEGDQNSSEHMAKFAAQIFRIRRAGATVLLLHHSIKGAVNGALTLDSAMRGSTELAAFVTSCWATRLVDPTEQYTSPSFLSNVKQRDFESKPFEASCDEKCKMTILGEPGTVKEKKARATDEATNTLIELMEDYPEAGVQKLRAMLADAGIKKGPKWVSLTKSKLQGTGVEKA